MCARRFLIVITILTLVVVAAAFAIFQFGGNILLKQATPKGHFEAAEAGSGPDYSSFDSWISRPDILVPGQPVKGVADDPARWWPEGQQFGHAIPTVSTFYIHPTTYLGRDRWNAPVHPGGETELRTRLFVRSQATALGLGDIWAPRYRQAAYGAFLLNSADAHMALDLAYSDVLAAFDTFIRETHGDNAIVLAGHSQGALHLMRLLRDRKDVLQGRLVAAYAVGWPISTVADLPALGFPACRAPEQSGCILSWMTFRDPPNPRLFVDQWEKTKGLAGGKRRKQDILCVNPITGTQNGSDPHGVAGYLVPRSDLTTATISYNAIAARCDKGLLLVDGELPSFGSYALPGNNYHVYDFALFWGAVRRDAARRFFAWQE
jgi:hypothetical protein